MIAHVQVNDPNRRGPGQGAHGASRPSSRRMRADAGAWATIAGIVAVEPFDYVPDGPGCAAHSIGYLRGVLEGLASHG